MNVTELNCEQLNELKFDLFYDYGTDDYYGNDLTDEEAAIIQYIQERLRLWWGIPDCIVYAAYDGFVFTEDDFC